MMKPLFWLFSAIRHYWPLPSLLTYCYGWVIGWGIRRRQREIVGFKVGSVKFPLTLKIVLVTFWYTPFRVIEVYASVLVRILPMLCLKTWPPVGHRVGHRVGHGLRHDVDDLPLRHDNNNNNNIIYIALYTKVLKRFTMEEETRIIKLTLPKK